jgi:plastocyanin/DNA-binding beta-propeller fold protein YncE
MGVGQMRQIASRAVVLLTIGVFVMLFAAPAGRAGQAPPAASNDVTVGELAPWFTPQTLRIEPGQEVVWSFSDARTLHTVTFLTGFDEPAKTVGFVGRKGSVRFTFDKPGLYVYVCAIHPYMDGQIAVGVNPAPQFMKPWPPASPGPLSAPRVRGRGEVWVDTQFQTRPGKMTPGTITVVDATTMRVKRVIDGDFDNPHNMMVSWDERYVIQTNWHANYLSVLSAQNGRVLKNRIRVGESPAHTHTTPQGKVVVTINAQDRIAVLDLSKLVDPAIPAAQVPVRYIEVPLGPHGGWISPDGRIMVAANALSGKMSVVDLNAEKLLTTVDLTKISDLDGKPFGANLPLYSAISRNGRLAATTTVLLTADKLLQGRVVFFDMRAPGSPKVVKVVRVGAVPIQSPFSPDGRWVVVANTGSATASIIAVDQANPGNIRVVNEAKAYKGAHGVAYGFKQGGGFLAYVTNKYAPVLTVIDLSRATPGKAGDVFLGPDAWGGNGVLVIRPRPAH